MSLWFPGQGGTVRDLGKARHTLLHLKWITNKDPVQHRELCSMLPGSLDGRGVWGRKDTCVCLADPLLFTWNYHNVVNRLYSTTKRFWCSKKKKVLTRGQGQALNFPSPQPLISKMALLNCGGANTNLVWERVDNSFTFPLFENLHKSKF